MPPVPTRISGANPAFEDSELVLGLVGPVGTNFDRFYNLLVRCAKRFRYKPNDVHLSDLAKIFSIEPPAKNDKRGLSKEAKRINGLMHAGNYLRLTSKKGEFLALAAASAIRKLRPSEPVESVLLKRVHVIRSLKHPDEVRALRRIYGGGFFLIGVTVSEKERRSYLRDDKGCSPKEVDDLLERDEHEEDPQYVDENGQNYGQRTRDTFQLADVFIRLDDEKGLERFLELVFGCPFKTPTKDEHAMFLAFGAALRSADLSRQVGAVVVSAAGDVVGLGANDVARAGGGLYWPEPGDQRDHVRGVDSNEAQRDVIINDVLTRVIPDGEVAQAWIDRGRKLIKGSPLMDITEYGRATHAEMEALLSCARSGVSTLGATLYSTTFPCHNCAKHLIAAGVSRVVYVEPYPKSQAKTLFGDSISLDEDRRTRRRGRRTLVRFEHFVGIGARRFVDLFSIALSSGTRAIRKKGGKKVDWSPDKGVVRVPCLPNSYLDRETLAEAELLAATTNGSPD
jgi:deoxycytidylate deaminase